MKNEVRNTNGYKIEKVERNAQGSYAITYNGKKSQHNYNQSTVRYLLMMSDSEFIEYAKEQFNWLTPFSGRFHPPASNRN